MTGTEDRFALGGAPSARERDQLHREWKRLGTVATVVAVFTSPLVFVTFYTINDWPLWLSIILTLFAIAAFRGLVDVICHRLIARPSLYDATEEQKRDDSIFRRRRWYWRTRFRRLLMTAVVVFVVLFFMMLFVRTFLGVDAGLFNSLSQFRDSVDPSQRFGIALQMILLFVQLPIFFLINFLIFFGPLLMFGVMQMKAFEPGDSDWGVKLDDVRGQKEPKEDVRRVIQLWSAGEEFKKAGGKPERGLLLIGAPGTGKTMLSKAIATSFNSPLMTMPGSGFAQTFIGLDVVIVMILVGRARRLARKWGGQCMVFIDEIDAVGRRRSGLGGSMGGFMTPTTAQQVEDHLFFGPWGSFSGSGDLILETRAWRERLFRERAPEPMVRSPQLDRLQNMIMPGMGGGGMALNQLLVQMDGMDSPPAIRKWATKKFNTFLDALYVVPQRVFGKRIRLPPAKPRGEQVYFIGATNVDINELDPALLRPGRMGRHIHFRTPTADDRKDIFNLYLGKVSHDPDLDSEARRDELARITHGYSPAMIEQVCSMALTFAHADRRPVFNWQDIIESMTTIESGTAIGVDYVAEETRAVAIHEAGHAVASHVYMDDVRSTRLSIRMRGGSLGHHQAIEKEERFSSWRHEDMGKLVWTLGAMAAEHVFYGENSRGVGGDVQSATALAALMVGTWGMGPEPVDLSESKKYRSEAKRREAEEETMRRFERIGIQIMNRAAIGNPSQPNPLASILGDPHKKRSAAQILGQSYITALCLMRHNREQVARIAETLIERKEIHGDEVVELLEAAQLEAPEIDITDESIWPSFQMTVQLPKPRGDA
jgi:ATP-dependent Zn protease